MDIPQYSVFVRTTLANHQGTSVSTCVIPARSELHAKRIADGINRANDDSYLRSQAFPLGGYDDSYARSDD